MKELYESLLDDFEDINQATDNYIMEQWINKYCTGNFKLRYVKGGIILKKNDDFIIKNCHESQLPEGLKIFATNSHTVKGNIKILNCDFESLEGLFDQKTCYRIEGDLIIENCTKLKHLGKLPNIGGDLSIFGNRSLRNLMGLPYLIDGTFYIYKNGRRFTKDYILDFIKKNTEHTFIMIDDIVDLNESIAESVDNEFITESVSNPHILKLIQQLKKTNNINSIDDVFSWITIDKLDSEYIEAFNKKKLLLNSKSIITKCRNIISGSRIGYILLKDEEGDFERIITSNKEVMWFKPVPNRKGYRRIFKSTELIDMCTSPKVSSIILITPDAQLHGTGQIRVDRSRARAGMVYNTPEYYKKVAEENLKRYKEIIKKNNILKNSNSDEYNKKVEKAVMRALKASSLAVSNPEKYKDKIWRLNNMMSYIYGEKAYIGNGKTQGQNGLLYYYSRYCVAVANAGKEWSSERTVNSYKQLMDDIIESIETYFRDFGV